jgi:hypothetical protein
MRTLCRVCSHLRAVLGAALAEFCKAHDAREKARQREIARADRQGNLFELEQSLDPPRRGPGRPPGARSWTTLSMAKVYMAEEGDPLRRGVRIAALPILANGVLEGLAERLGCSRFDAAKWWAGVYASTLPFIHQRLGQLEVKPAGAPGSNNPVGWSFDSGQIVDMVPEAQNEPER